MSNLTACKDCRHIHVAGNMGFCGASPAAERFDCYFGKMLMPEPPYLKCWVVNKGACKKFEKREGEET